MTVTRCTKCGKIVDLDHDCYIKENKMKYPMIEKLGLKVSMHEKACSDLPDTWAYVPAYSLEKLLSEAQTVTGTPCGGQGMLWSTDEIDKYDTHTAKLLCIEKLKRGVTKAEIVEALQAKAPYTTAKLIERIEAEGIID